MIWAYHQREVRNTPSTTARFSIPSASSTPSSRISLPFADPFSPISPPQAERTPQRMQITASSAENDSLYLCSEESPRTLFSFFSNTLTTSCFYCGKPLGCESLVFNRQSHVVSVTISCVGGDSFKWLSSPIMGGSPPKYYVNLRWALFYFCLKFIEICYLGILQFLFFVTGHFSVSLSSIDSWSIVLWLDRDCRSPKCNNYPKCNKVLNVITVGPKCNKALNVITFGPKCNKAPMQSFNCANIEMWKWQLLHQRIVWPVFMAYCGLTDINQRLFIC